ncbi:MAG: cytochrome c [Mariprofundaceae bacterium]|nr:cytochrome c [Mariprofundaceae bacterium]
MNKHVLLFLSLCILPTTNLHADDGAFVGDAMRGKVIFENTCAYCHKLGEEKSTVGATSLNGVGQRRSDTWLDNWVKSPSDFAKVNVEAKRMTIGDDVIIIMPTLPQMQDDHKRLDVITYIKTL